MRKIPTVFVRDPDDMARVTREMHPDCAWVLAGEGDATRKYDGTCVLLGDPYGSRSRVWWARREVKPGKMWPVGFAPVETDDVTGKTVGWEPIGQSGFAEFFHEVMDDSRRVGLVDWPVGTYELCGPKINKNPEGFEGHVLVPHAGAEIFDDAPRDFDGLMSWLIDHDQYEGIVWHRSDGRMAKLKRRDALRSVVS